MTSVTLSLIAFTGLVLGGQSPAIKKPETATNQKPATSVKKPDKQRQETLKDNSPKAEQNRTPEDLLTENQKRALYRLRNLQIEIKEIADPESRIKLQGQIADALWSFDSVVSRQQFKDAFQEIDTINGSQNNAASVNMKGQEKAASKNTDTIKIELRNYLIRLLLSRDSDLADSLINSQRKDEQSENEKVAAKIAEQRLMLAKGVAELNPEKAIAISKDEIRNNFSEDPLGALFAVRQYHQGKADAAFADILSWADSNKNLYSYNAIGILGGYILAVEEMQNPNSKEVISAAIFEKYLKFAYKVIEFNLQNTSIMKGEDVSQSYRAMQSLLPLFDRHLPHESAKLRSHLNELSKSVPLKSKEVTLADRPTDPSSVDDLLSLADENIDQQERDVLITRACMIALQQGDYEHAIYIAQKISAKWIKERTISIIHYQAGKKAGASKDIGKILEHARLIESSLSQRWALFHDAISYLISSGDKTKAGDLLVEYEDYVRTLEEDNPERAWGLFEAANAWGKLDILKARITTQFAIKTLNSVKFNKPQVKGKIIMKPEMFIFGSLWTSLARSDFDQTLLLSQAIADKSISTIAQINICKAFLSEVSSKQ